MRVKRGQHAIDGGFHRGLLVNLGHIVLTGAGQYFSEQVQLLIRDHPWVFRAVFRRRKGREPHSCATQYDTEGSPRQ